MSLTKTNIEYLDRAWNPSGWGCARHCPYCYAERLAKRNMSKCPQCNAFVPHKHPARLHDPIRAKQPYIIGVDFMSDLFGAGVAPEWVKEILWTINRGNVYDEIASQHHYLFLTKSPENLAQFNPWPDNAWVGITITGEEALHRQAEMANSMPIAKHKWISFEPLLKPIDPYCMPNEHLSWIVIGAQSGPGAVVLELSWVLEIIEAADRVGCRVWLKNNLLKLYPELPRRQELP